MKRLGAALFSGDVARAAAQKTPAALNPSEALAKRSPRTGGTWRLGRTRLARLPRLWRRMNLGAANNQGTERHVDAAIRDAVVVVDDDDRRRLRPLWRSLLLLPRPVRHEKCDRSTHHAEHRHPSLPAPVPGTQYDPAWRFPRPTTAHTSRPADQVWWQFETATLGTVR
jgi:hypothetical protein